MKILCFHVPSRNWSIARKYWGWYLLMAGSVRKVQPGAKFILITHEDSDIPQGLPIDDILRIPAHVAPQDHSHLLRVYGWWLYVTSRHFDDDTISVDTDLLFQSSPIRIFDDEFDIGLTYECIQKTHWASVGKINTGVMFLRPANKDRVKNFFDQFYAKLLEMKDQPDIRFVWGDRHPTLKEWGGDEIALMALFEPGALVSGDQASKAIDVAGARVRVYPSRPWNCQICCEEDGALTMPFLSDVVIRHFSGPRKPLMEPYAAAHLGIGMEFDPNSRLGQKVAFR